MKTRSQRLYDLQSHPMLGKLFYKLKPSELDAVAAFVKENESLSRDEYMLKANRWHVDDPNKPVNLTTMWSIVTQVV